MCKSPVARCRGRTRDKVCGKRSSQSRRATERIVCIQHELSKEIADSSSHTVRLGHAGRRLPNCNALAVLPGCGAPGKERAVFALFASLKDEVSAPHEVATFVE